MGYSIERSVAAEAVVKACRLCREVQAALVSESTLAKKDKSPVTVADYGAQAVVSAALAASFPNDPLVGEEHAGQLRADEGAAVLEKVVHHARQIEPGLDEEAILAAIDRGSYAGGSSGRHWTLDPIDGTKGFLRGDQYAVALALIEDGVPVLGVLGCPNLPLDASRPDGAESPSQNPEITPARRRCHNGSGPGSEGCLFIAVKSEGAAMRPVDGGDESAIATTAIDDPSRAAFCESVESGHSSHDDAAKIAELLGVSVPPYRIDSQCKYAAVARGDASIYLRLPTRADYEEKIWDHAAGWMVVTEAGGKVTDVTGKPLDFSLGRTLSRNKGVVATNGRLHERVIEAVRSVLRT